MKNLLPLAVLVFCSTVMADQSTDERHVEIESYRYAMSLDTSKGLNTFRCQQIATPSAVNGHPRASNDHCSLRLTACIIKTRASPSPPLRVQTK
jgi:hypothetical protein